MRGSGSAVYVDTDTESCEIDINHPYIFYSGVCYQFAESPYHNEDDNIYKTVYSSVQAHVES